MIEFIQGLAGRILSDGGLSAFILFWALVSSNFYHIKQQNRMHMQNREDLAAAWKAVWTISESTTGTLKEVSTMLIVVRDRLERH